MINGMNIPYYSSKGKGLKVVSKGLEPVQTKGKGCKKVKKPHKMQKASGLKILN